jgi:hypothetical protein
MAAWMCLINDIPNLIGIYIIKVVTSIQELIHIAFPSPKPFHGRNIITWILPALSISNSSIAKGVKCSSLLLT